jgi:hypothetical protein
VTLIHKLYGRCAFVFRWAQHPQYICVRNKDGFLITELESDFQRAREAAK